MRARDLSTPSRIEMVHYLADELHESRVRLGELQGMYPNWRSKTVAGHIAYQAHRVATLRDLLRRLGGVRASISS